MDRVTDTGEGVWLKTGGGGEKVVNPQKITRLKHWGVRLKLVGVEISYGL